MVTNIVIVQILWMTLTMIVVLRTMRSIIVSATTSMRMMTDRMMMTMTKMLAMGMGIALLRLVVVAVMVVGRGCVMPCNFCIAVHCKHHTGAGLMRYRLRAAAEAPGPVARDPASRVPDALTSITKTLLNPS